MAAVLRHEVHTHGPPRERLPVLLWRLPAGSLAIASASLGGGLGERSWIVNAEVPSDYRHPDPARHLGEIAREVLAGGGDGTGTDEGGIGFLTAASVTAARYGTDHGAEVAATVGVTLPTWAAAPDEGFVDVPTVGTINLVCWVPERLGDAALVNAVMTVTEAKVQALGEAGIPGTGTATDAVAVVCPATGSPHAYGGPRSLWGARLARATHQAVTAGLASSGPA